MEQYNGWKEYSRMVLNELERLSIQSKEIQKEIHNLSIDIATLQVRVKVRAGMWGMVAGLIPGIVAYFIKK